MANGRRSAIDGRTARGKGHAMSQQVRKRIEQGFGWVKTIGGLDKLPVTTLARAAVKLDTNHDGRITYLEAEAQGFSERQCRTWDKNEDGTLEQNELAAMHAILDVPVRELRPRR
jgi:hypothetical protein